MRLYAIRLLQLLRRKQEGFWGLLFPIVMATLFFVSFGNGVDPEKMSAVPAALVSRGNQIFERLLQEMDGAVLNLNPMEEEEALEALAHGEVKGIFYSEEEPSLTVTSLGIQETVLETLLRSYLENQTMILQIGEQNPAGLIPAAAQISRYGDYLESADINGGSMETNLGYFYALISMACLFGAFLGMTCATEMRADQSPLALRRSVAPVHRLSLVLAEMAAAFTVQFGNVCLLLLYLRLLGLSFGGKWALLLPVCALGSMAGVAFGMFVGSAKMREGFKNTVLIGSSLLMSFFAGLMFVNMKDIVEHHAPLLNRINPAALIADAFYSISIYDNPERYRRNLFLLAAITSVFVLTGFWRLRRERYESL